MLALAFVIAQVVQSPVEAKSKAVTGPKLLCMKYSSFQLAEGERVVKVGLGFESMHLEIRSSRKRFGLGESEIFAGPKISRPLFDRSDARIRVASEGSYWLYGRPSFSPDQDKPIVVVEKLSAVEADGVLARLKLGDTSVMKCQHRYFYGWEYMFPDSQAPK